MQLDNQDGSPGTTKISRKIVCHQDTREDFLIQKNNAFLPHMLVLPRSSLKLVQRTNAQQFYQFYLVYVSLTRYLFKPRNVFKGHCSGSAPLQLSASNPSGSDESPLLSTHMETFPAVLVLCIRAVSC